MSVYALVLRERVMAGQLSENRSAYSTLAVPALSTKLEERMLAATSAVVDSGKRKDSQAIHPVCEALDQA